jgi:hypothetical protein
MSDTPATTEEIACEQIAADETVPVDKNAEITATAAPVSASPITRRNFFIGLTTLTGAAALSSGLLTGYVLWGWQDSSFVVTPPEDSVPLHHVPQQQIAVDLPASYTFPVHFGSLGPQLVQAGVIDKDAFAQVFAASKTPLGAEQLALLDRASDEPITITHANAHFLLNFLWAVGLANSNPLLIRGAMQTESNGDPTGFASTGGWTISMRPVADIYAKLLLVPLNAEQQERLEAAAGLVYRPCCENATDFPDCNHGMAMLGLLELMAAHNATVDEMMEAAKYANAFWFPQQMAEVATYLKVTRQLELAEADGREVSGKAIFASSGFQSVNKWLADTGYLNAVPVSGAQCGV